MSVKSRLQIIPIRAQARFDTFDLPSEVFQSILSSGETVQESDILVVSSKYAAISEGRMIDLSQVDVDQGSKDLANKFNLEPSLARLILNESEVILGGIPGFVLSVVSGTLAPN